MPWQPILATIIVALALFALGRRLVRFVRGKSAGCGSGSCGTGCGRNATGEASSQKPLPLSSIGFRDQPEASSK